MTTVRTYRSSDSSAPTLNGVAGSLVSVLDGCLVNGYGSTSAAGWAKSFSGTNKASYRNSATDGTGFYLYVDDSAPGAGGGAEARCTGFQTQSSLGVGTGQFPTSSQLAIGIGAVVWRKSAALNSVARNWTLIADDTVFYLFVEAADYTNPMNGVTYLYWFGDFFSYNPSDLYRCTIQGRTLEGSTSLQYSCSAQVNSGNSNTYGQLLNNTLGGHFCAASFTGVGGSLVFGKHTDTVKLNGPVGFGTVAGNGSAYSGASNTGINPVIGNVYNNAQHMNYPNPADGQIHMAPIWIHHNNGVRGYLKGLWSPVQSLPLNHNDTFSGASGKSFLSQWELAYIYNQGPGNLSAVPANFLVETSSTWS